MKNVFTFYETFLEINTEDAETEVALNLICVDETTRQTIDIPIRSRSVKDYKNEAHKKQIRSSDVFKIDSESKIKLRFERSDGSIKSGKQKLIELIFRKTLIQTLDWNTFTQNIEISIATLI